jgi:peptidoglycan/xylan/chitin deacetylase (PgdA/CDA1 family)
MHARALTTNAPATRPFQLAPVAVQPWPRGAQAAVSFSFDWETTMGGLIHSRSLVADDPNNAEPPRERGLRMRQGITNTLELFRSYNIHATYYATGYNFLRGNTARRTFMGDPTFTWATQANGWKSDWSQRRWFSTDPHSALPNDPDYYFADLLPALRAAGQDIQTHTFSHLYGGYASPAEWQADFSAWREAAAAQGIAPARSLAFPWSGSGGMSDASWQVLAHAGITSVTRTNRSQSQYQLVTPTEPQCRPVPGHERILVCPDFYLTPQSAAQALALLDSTRQAGQVWIAPLAEIADWQQAVAQLRIEPHTPDAHAPLDFTITNTSAHPLNGVTLELPFAPTRVAVDGNAAGGSFAVHGTSLTLTIPAGQAVEVQAWPA